VSYPLACLDLQSPGPTSGVYRNQGIGAGDFRICDMRERSGRNVYVSEHTFGNLGGQYGLCLHYYREIRKQFFPSRDTRFLSQRPTLIILSQIW
jgi:hypothetical protein